MALLVALMAVLSAAHLVAQDTPTTGAPGGMTVDDFLRLETIDDAAVDRSSSMVAIVVQRARLAGEPTRGEGLYRGNVRADVVVFSARTGRAVMRTQGHSERAGYWYPRWAPGGGSLAMLSLHGDTLSVCVWRRATGVLACQPASRSLDYITHLSVGATIDKSRSIDNAFLWLSDSVLAMAVLPDGRSDLQLVRSHRVEDSVAASWRRQDGGQEPTASVLDSPRPTAMSEDITAIQLWNVANGTTRAAFNLPYFAQGTRDIVFSPDLDRAVVLADRYRPLSRPSTRYGFHNNTRTELGVVNLRRDTTVWWSPRRPYSHMVRWGPGGNSFGVMVKRSEDEDVLRGNRLFVVNATKQAVDSSMADAAMDSTYRWKPRALPTTEAGAIAPGDHLLATAPDGSFSIVRRVSQTGTAVYQLPASGGEARLLIALNAHRVDVASASRLLITYTAHDGSEQRGVVLLPPGARRGVRYPVVAWLYPGTLYADTADANWLLAEDDQIFLNPNILAGHGYAVLFPSMPFVVLAGGVAEPYRHMLDGIEPAIDTLIQRGIADSTRLGVIGHSYGGYAVNCIVSQSHRFRAAVSLAGVADLTSFVLQIQPPSRYIDLPSVWLPWAEAGQGRMGSPPWRDPERYWRNSPIAYADSVNTPVLIVSGDNDYMGQAEEWFVALHRAGKRARFVRYWGEGHRILSPANVKNLWQEILGWFDSYLQPSHTVPHLGDRGE